MRYNKANHGDPILSTSLFVRENTRTKKQSSGIGRVFAALNVSHMIDFIQSIKEEELRFISNLDYGSEADKHYEGLRKVIFKQNCLGNMDQNWYPYEVIELGANWLQEKHDREFTICTLLVIYNVLGGNDCSTDLEYKFETHAKEYDQLPKEYQNLVVSAYEQANI